MAKRGMTSFGRTVRKRMIDMDISHGELSKRIGCSKSYLTDMLAGRRSGVKYIEPICNELQMPRQTRPKGGLHLE